MNDGVLAVHQWLTRREGRSFLLSHSVWCVMKKLVWEVVTTHLRMTVILLSVLSVVFLHKGLHSRTIDFNSIPPFFLFFFETSMTFVFIYQYSNFENVVLLFYVLHRLKTIIGFGVGAGANVLTRYEVGRWPCLFGYLNSIMQFV